MQATATATSRSSKAPSEIRAPGTVATLSKPVTVDTFGEDMVSTKEVGTQEFGRETARQQWEGKGVSLFRTGPVHAHV